MGVHFIETCSMEYRVWGRRYAMIITGKWAWLSCLFVTFKCHQGGLWLPVAAVAYVELLFACVR